MANIAEKDVLRDAQKLVLKAITDGTTLEEFKKEWSGFSEEHGLSVEKPHLVETMYRSEVGRAYGAGKVTALRDPDVKQYFPMWQYVAIDDDRVRDEHIALEGFTAEPDDPFWLSHTPPWDWNCRCSFIPLTQRRIDRDGIEPSGTVEVDGVEQDPRAWPTSPGYRGIGLAARQVEHVEYLVKALGYYMN